MQLIVHIGLDRPLVLPLNYNHILQSIIYRAIGNMPGIMQTFLHNDGIHKRQAAVPDVSI